jgi:hypothetical protein
MVAVAALLAIFAGCKAESPTAPPSVGNGGTGGAGNPPSGGVTPPVGASIILTVSNPNPLTNSVTTISATVTQNGTLVPNGTAVEFVTDVGTFTDTQDVKTIRTTTNGVASAVLTNSSAGVATVTVTVNNVTKSVQITFTDLPVTPPPANTSPTISTVTPNTGPPAGGTVIVIAGTNFRTPVRVVFDAGPAGVKEAFVNQSTVTPTQIIAVTPKIDLVSTQTQAAAITVIVDAGNPTEARVTKSAAFTYVTTNLTPVIRFISPTSGPIDGGTQVTIAGDAFESPVQVFFGSAQVQVISVNFNQIIVMSPTARDTNPNATGTVTGPVAVKVLNGNSGKSVTLADGFRYIPKMQITTVAPLIGSALGGTDVKIDGTGFNEPVSVFIGGALAQVLKVTGTEILARTGRLASPCGATNGPIIVTNTDNGDTATAPAIYVFQYVGVQPLITSVNFTPSSPPNDVPRPGASIQVGVLNPGIGPLGTALVRFSVGGISTTATPNPISNGTGTTIFNVIIPAGLTFPQVACTTGSGAAGTQGGPITVPVTFLNVTTACADAVGVPIQVFPPAPNACVAAPPIATLSSPAQTCPTTSNLTPPSVVAAGTVTHTATITISNTSAGEALTLGAPGITPNNATVTVTPNTAQVVSAGASQNYTVTVDPTAAGPDGATITFSTNDPARPTVTVIVCGSAT